MIHSKGETPLYEMRAMITARGPSGVTKITLLAGTKRVIIAEQPDPMGWIENWGIIADDLVSIVSRRTAHRYGGKKE
jgi:hypothetical protein